MNIRFVLFLLFLLPSIDGLGSLNILNAQTQSKESSLGWIVRLYEPVELIDETTFGVKPNQSQKLNKEGTLWLVNDDRIDKKYLNNLKSVKRYERDQVLELRNDPVVPNDPLYNTQWALESIQAPEVWQHGTGGYSKQGDRIVVAVLDRTFQIDHPELDAKKWTNPQEVAGDGVDNDGNGFIDDLHGWNFHNNTSEYDADGLGHGTQVSGIIGSETNNGEGMSAVNWDVELMYFMVSNVSHAYAAYDYIANMRRKYNETNGAEGAFIVVSNQSSGVSGFFCDEAHEWNLAIEKVYQQGVLAVASADNSSVNIDVVGDLPGTCPSDGSIIVTNSDRAQELYEDAAFGFENVDLAAPGVGIATLDFNSDYTDGVVGASFSSPYVAGSVALLYSIGCDTLFDWRTNGVTETADLMKEIILDNVEVNTTLSGNTVSGGTLNLAKARNEMHARCAQWKGKIQDSAFEDLIEEGDLIRVFPNPTFSTITLAYSAIPFEVLEVELVDAAGREIWNYSINTLPFEAQEVTFDCSKLGAGVYYLHVLGVDEKLSTSIIKQ